MYRQSDPAHRIFNDFLTDLIFTHKNGSHGEDEQKHQTLQS